jgi:hypothetical protein
MPDIVDVPVGAGRNDPNRPGDLDREVALDIEPPGRSVP